MAFRVPVAPQDLLQALMSGSQGGGLTNAPRKVPGRRVPGNIDFSSRPKVKNRDGSVSTVRSASFGTPEGEVLVPTIGPQGQDWSPQQAWAYAQQTGQNLGTFDSPESADAYAQWLHNQQAQLAGHDPQDQRPQLANAPRVRLAGGPPDTAPRLPALSGAPQMAPEPDVTVSSGLGQPVVPTLGAPASAPRIGQRKPVSVLRTAADFVLGGENPFDSMDRQKAQYQLEQAAMARRDQLLQFAQTLPEGPVREAFLLNPEEFSKSFYDPKTVGQNAFNPATGEWNFLPQVNVASDQAVTSQQGPDGRITQTFQAPPELTPYQRAQVDKPQVVGDSLVTRQGQVLYSEPQLKTVGEGDSLVQVNPGGQQEPGQPIDPEAVWSRMIGMESGGGNQFGPDGKPLTSPKGAIGAAQVMPETAPEAARLAGLPWDPQRYQNDRDYNLAIGKAYYQSLVQRYKGDTVLAAAAYQSGPGNVDAAVAKYGPNWVQGLGPQGQDYVRGVVGGQGVGTKVLAQGQPKPGYRPATPADLAQYPGLDTTRSYQVSPNGQLEPIGTSGEMTPRQLAQTSVSLRQQFNSEGDVKAFNDVASSYDVIQRLAQQPPTAANDISLIFSYMKMLDPGSVVREGEFATAQNATGVPGAVVNAYNKALKGQRLNPEQRRQFVGTAQSVFDARKTRYEQLVKQYQGYAADQGLDPKIIQSRLGDAQPSPQYSPKQAAALAPIQQRLAQLKQQGLPVPPSGSPGNPLVRTSAKQDASIPKGAYFIDVDGVTKIKGAKPGDIGTLGAAPRKQPALPTPKTPQEAAALPKGTRFMWTDGQEYVRQ